MLAPKATMSLLDMKIHKSPQKGRGKYVRGARTVHGVLPPWSFLGPWSMVLMICGYWLTQLSIPVSEVAVG